MADWNEPKMHKKYTCIWKLKPYIGLTCIECEDRIEQEHANMFQFQRNRTYI